MLIPKISVVERKEVLKGMHWACPTRQVRTRDVNPPVQGPIFRLEATFPKEGNPAGHQFPSPSVLP